MQSRSGTTPQIHNLFSSFSVSFQKTVVEYGHKTKTPAKGAVKIMTDYYDDSIYEQPETPRQEQEALIRSPSSPCRI